MLNFLLFISIFFVANVNAALIEDQKGHKISPEIVSAYLDLENAPEGQAKVFLQNKNAVTKQMQNLYLLTVLAEKAQNEGLLIEEKDKLKLKIMQDTFYFGLKLKQVLAQNLPKFEGLAKNYYVANKETYKKSEQIDVSHIMLKVEDKDEAKVLAVAKELQEKLAQGQAFSKLAIEYSEDPTVEKNQGHLGVFARGKLVTAIEKVAYSLKDGEVSQPVKTKFGYHLIKRNQYYPAKYASFAEVKDKIIGQIKSEYLKDKKAEYFDKVVSDNQMKFNDKEIEAYITEKLQQF
jgi:peptidyl-prolyl cis-trans isomerase C